MYGIYGGSSYGIRINSSDLIELRVVDLVSAADVFSGIRIYCATPRENVFVEDHFHLFVLDENDIVSFVFMDESSDILLTELFVFSFDEITINDEAGTNIKTKLLMDTRGNASRGRAWGMKILG